jgi:head-tail adaptor
MRHRVRIMQPAADQNSYGGSAPTYSAYRTAWMELRPLGLIGARERLVGAATEAQATHILVGRPDRNVTAKTRILFGRDFGRTLEVVGPPIGIEEGSDEMTLLVRETE